ncbi:MAG: cytochrome c-type biogenesis protein [Thermincolia bacterium]
MRVNLRKFALLGLLLTLLMSFAAGPVSAAEVDEKLQKEIEAMLVCMDDCGMIVAVCDNSTAEYMRGILKEKLAQGMNKEQVLKEFVKIYGTKVLAAPPKEGFNITAWVTPFVAILAGALIIYFTLDKWVFNKEDEELDSGRQAAAKLERARLEEYEDKLDEELKKYL